MVKDILACGLSFPRAKIHHARLLSTPDCHLICILSHNVMMSVSTNSSFDVTATSQPPKFIDPDWSISITGPKYSILIGYGLFQIAPFAIQTRLIDRSHCMMLHSTPCLTRSFVMSSGRHLGRRNNCPKGDNLVPTILLREILIAAHSSPSNINLLHSSTNDEFKLKASRGIAAPHKIGQSPGSLPPEFA